MKRSFGNLLPAALAVLVLASFAMAPYADAARWRRWWRWRWWWRRRRRRGGGGGGGGARAGGGGGGGGGARQSAQVEQQQGRCAHQQRPQRQRQQRQQRQRRTERQRERERNNGCCNNGWDNDYHPVATAAAVTAAVAVTSAVVGSMVRTVPPSCVPVNYGGMVYQQCGGTWYAPAGVAVRRGQSTVLIRSLLRQAGAAVAGA